MRRFTAKVGRTNSERLPRATFDLVTLQTLSDRAGALAILNAVRNALVPGGVCVAIEPPASPTRLSPALRLSEAHLRTLSLQAGFAQFARHCPDHDHDHLHLAEGYAVFEMRR